MHTLKKHWIKITIAVYLSCILGYTLVFSIFNWGNLAPLTSNELGDFLSGSFAPLAFFILIMGYIQQGKEMKYQSEELQKSVEQQIKILDLNQKQFDYLVKDNLIKNQPIFDILNDMDFVNSNSTLYLKLIMVSGFARSVYIHENDYFSIKQNLQHLLTSDNEDLSMFKFSITENGNKWQGIKNMPLKISYIDYSGKMILQKFRVFFDDDSKKIKNSLLEEHIYDDESRF